MQINITVTPYSATHSYVTAYHTLSPRLGRILLHNDIVPNARAKQHAEELMRELVNEFTVSPKPGYRVVRGRISIFDPLKPGTPPQRKGAEAFVTQRHALVSMANSLYTAVQKQRLSSFGDGLRRVAEMAHQYEAMSREAAHLIKPAASTGGCPILSSAHP